MYDYYNKSIFFINMIAKLLKNHQRNAINGIDKALNNCNKCLVDMFCGSGKTRIILCDIIFKKYNLSVIVFPTISLVTQFNKDYILNNDFISFLNDYNILSICSKDEIHNKKIKYTTNETDIKMFLGRKNKKIITVTYKSYEKLVNIIKSNKFKLDVLFYDEAHHTVENGIKDIAYNNKEYEKLVSHVIFLTATPKNDNGIIMYDHCNPQNMHTGILAYKYSYMDGVMNGVLNDFDIMVYFCKNKMNDNNDNDHVKNKYEYILKMIARVILETDNRKILTFHSRSEVENENYSDVMSFAENEELFKKIFNDLLNKEYLHKKSMYRDCEINLKGITGKYNDTQHIINEFNKKDNNIYILSSCKTIGEGIDTREANVCIFIDAKHSIYMILQNIGRITRKKDKKSIVVLFCMIDIDKYNTITTQEDIDIALREDLNENGNFNVIINVLTALKQNDPKYYDACLKYPYNLTKYEIKKNLNKYGYKLIDCSDNTDTLKRNKMKISKNINPENINFDENYGLFNRPLEIHKPDIDNPIKYYNEKHKGIPVILYQNNLGKIHSIEKNKGTNKLKEIKKPIKSKININYYYDFELDIYLGFNKLTFEKNIQLVCMDILVKKNKWLYKYESLKEWLNKNHKKPNPKTEDSTEKRHGNFVNNQRRKYREASLSDERIKYMMALPFINFAHDKFDEYKELQEFMIKTGRRPKNTGYEKILAKRLSKLEEKFRLNKLEDDVIKLMEEIFWYKFSREKRGYKRFEERYNQLVKFKQKTGKYPSRSGKTATADEQYLAAYFDKYKSRRRLAPADDKWNKLHQLYPKKFQKKNISITSTISTISIMSTQSDNDKLIKRQERQEKREKQGCNNSNISNKCRLKCVNKFYLKNKKNIKNSGNAIISRTKSELSKCHKIYQTMSPNNLHNLFKKNPRQWYEYHELRKQSEQNYREEDIPRNRVIKYLEKAKTISNRIILDAGCGLAQISKHFKDYPKFEFKNIDHIACDETVISRDMTDTEFDDNSVDIIIMCLSLWGNLKTCEKYIKEMYRILVADGNLLIVVPANKWIEEYTNDDKNDNDNDDDKYLLNIDGVVCKNYLEELVCNNGFDICSYSMTENIKQFPMRKFLEMHFKKNI